MSERKFNPNDAKYKKVEDLPKDKQADFVNDGNGFVLKTAADTLEKASTIAVKHNKERTLLDKLSGVNRETYFGVLQEQAMADNVVFEQEKEQRQIEQIRKDEEERAVQEIKHEISQMTKIRKKREKREIESLDKAAQAEKLLSDLATLPASISAMFNHKDKAIELLRQYTGSDGFVRTKSGEVITLAQLLDTVRDAVFKKSKITNESGLKGSASKLSIEILKAYLEGRKTLNFSKESAARSVGVVNFEHDYSAPNEAEDGSSDE